jgi:hypothetical protein
LIERRQQIFAAAAIAIRPRPHAVTGLAADDEFVAQPAEIFAQNAPDALFGSARRRAVVVGQVEMIDAAIESGKQHLAAVLVEVVFVVDAIGRCPNATEVVPAAKRNRRQFQAARATTPICHRVVTVFVG